jgi:hypothetical protein
MTDYRQNHPMTIYSTTLALHTNAVSAAIFQIYCKSAVLGDFIPLVKPASM